ncbi:MAG: hypothetical protein ACM3Q1_06520 [Bacteroidales bacterium]
MMRFVRWTLLYAGLGLVLIYQLGRPADESGRSRVAFEYQQF